MTPREGGSLEAEIPAIIEPVTRTFARNVRGPVPQVGRWR